MGMPDLDQEQTPLDSSDTVPHVLLVDDDPVFGALMGRAAAQSRVNLTYCKDEAEVSKCLRWKFDVAIVDYHLGRSNGIDVTKQLEKLPLPVPVILISAGRMLPTPISSWPDSIKGFMEKNLGHLAILEAALAAHEMALAHRNAKTENQS